MKKVSVLLFLAFCIALAGAAVAADVPAAQPGAPAAAAPAPAPVVKYDAVGAPMPPDTMKAVKGDSSVILNKLAKPSMFMFVNSSCSACRTELVSFAGMAEKLKAKLNVYVVTVDFDPANTISRFPDLANMPYTLLDGSDFKVAGKLGFNFTPATVLVDASGKQTFRKGGFAAGDENVIVAEVMKIAK